MVARNAFRKRVGGALKALRDCFARSVTVVLSAPASSRSLPGRGSPQHSLECSYFTAQLRAPQPLTGGAAARPRARVSLPPPPPHTIFPPRVLCSPPARTAPSLCRPKEIPSHDIKDFLLTVRRKDAKKIKVVTVKSKKGDNVTKRCG